MKAVRYTVRIGGVLMILMGALMFTGKMNDITGYLSTVQEETVQEKDGSGEAQRRGRAGAGRMRRMRKMRRIQTGRIQIRKMPAMRTGRAARKHRNGRRWQRLFLILS